MNFDHVSKYKDVRLELNKATYGLFSRESTTNRYSLASLEKCEEINCYRNSAFAENVRLKRPTTCGALNRKGLSSTQPPTMVWKYPWRLERGKKWCEIEKVFPFFGFKRVRSESYWLRNVSNCIASHRSRLHISMPHGVGSWVFDLYFRTFEKSLKLQIYVSESVFTAVEIFA